MVLGGTWSEQGGSGCLYDMLSENIWFASMMMMMKTKTTMKNMRMRKVIEMMTTMITSGRPDDMMTMIMPRTKMMMKI